MKKNTNAIGADSTSTFSGSAYSVKMRKWVKDQAMSLEGSIAVCHIFPRAYCVAKPAPLCAVFVEPWMDAESQVRNKKYSGSVTIDEGAENVNVGDWCAIAYVVRNGLARNVAFKLPNDTDKGRIAPKEASDER